MTFIQKALDTLVIMNTAMKVMRLYPPASPSIINTVEKLHQAFLDMFLMEEGVVFAESERALLICGEPLSQKDQEKPQAVTLLDIMLGFGIRSISFDKGLAKEELTVFLEILGRKPETVNADGGLPQLIMRQNFAHIRLDEKIYVASDKNHQILAGLDIADDQIIRFVTHANPQLEADSGKILEMAKNPEWLMQTFQYGAELIMAKKGTMTDLQLTDNLLYMITLLDKATGKMAPQDREQIAHYIGHNLSTLDLDLAEKTVTENMRDLFGGALMQFIMTRLEESKSVECTVSKTGVFDGILDVDTATDGQKTADQGLPLSLEEKFDRFLKNDERVFLDVQLMAVLPRIFERFDARNDQETLKMIIDRLVDKLSSENVEVRTQAATALAEILTAFPPERKGDMVARLSIPLVDWIKREIMVTPAFRDISNGLKDLVQDYIENGQFMEALPVLSAFSDIHAGPLEKDETIHEWSAEIIQSLASERNFKCLFHEYSTNEQNRQEEAGKILVKLGHTVLTRLLDILRDLDSSTERVQLMRLIISTGQTAVPAVRDRINDKEPWYYLRNLAYMLGRIGNETCAPFLQPLLIHEDSRVRMEALKSIQRTGGKESGPLLLSVLPHVDKGFALNIIETLGNVKCTASVPYLLNILKDHPLVYSTARANLEETICGALGSIGSAEAIPALSEIADASSFFRLRSYPSKIKNAADRALVSIKEKQS